jgi:hypothetical protein
VARLSPGFRPLVGISLLTRTPSLYNAIPDATLSNFVENLPLRGEPIRIDTVPGASAIQELIDRNEGAGVREPGRACTVRRPSRDRPVREGRPHRGESDDERDPPRRGQRRQGDLFPQ